MLTQPLVSQSFLDALECPQCSVGLHLGNDELECIQCGARWPVIDGIPCFSNGDGDLSQTDAESLLLDTARYGWQAAIEDHLARNGQMRHSMAIRQQRAAWLPLIGLRDDAIALDIGSGYGTITHALATTVHKVYSVEAVPALLEFTRLRMQQEDLANVYFVRGEATELPLAENVFDLVVVNTKLELVGEGRTKEDPREIHVRFLRRLQRSLKPGGVLIIGGKNRFGHQRLRGTDHSGVPLTNLRSPSIASLVSPHQSTHYRTELNPIIQHRHTYCEYGYKKLLLESGFPFATFYWAYPRYNRPSALVSTERQPLAAHVLRTISDPSLDSRAGRWGRLLKFKLARLGLLRFFIAEFLIIAAKDGNGDPSQNSKVIQSANSLLPKESRITNPVGYLCSITEAGKSVILLSEHNEFRTRLVIKTWARGSTEPGTLVQVHSRVSEAEAETDRFMVPAPLGSFTLNSRSYAVETPAEGQSIAALILNSPPRKRLRFLEVQLPMCARAAMGVSRVLSATVAVPGIDSTWLTIPDQTLLDRQIASYINMEASRWKAQGVRAHGDFSIENIFWEASGRRIWIIDWAHVIEGVPPLYDVITLLLSAVPALALEHREANNHDVRSEQQFLAAFFGAGAWAKANAKILHTARARMEHTNLDIWKQFLLSLVIRANDFFARKSKLANQYCRLIELASKNRARFVCLGS